MAGSETGNTEGKVIVLIFLGVCSLIALSQLFPAIKKLFHAPVAMETRKEEADNTPDGQV